MRVYFLRHGEADWPGWDRPDDERPLTKKGKKELVRVAEFLADREAKPARLLSSPLPRAYQTAAVVAEAFKMPVTEEPALAPGFDAGQLTRLLRQYAGQDLMLVGHEPSFSEAIAALTGGRVRLAKGGVARVDLDDPNQMRGQLIWLIPPKMIR